MIILTRLGGHELAVNPDLIERAESTPDTVLTMVDGHKMIVVESLDEVISEVLAWRAAVAAAAYTCSHGDAEPRPEQLEDIDQISELATQGVPTRRVVHAVRASVLRLPTREG